MSEGRLVTKGAGDGLVTVHNQSDEFEDDRFGAARTDP